MDFRIGITFADLLFLIYVYMYLTSTYPALYLSAMLPVARNGLCRHPFFSQV